MISTSTSTPSAIGVRAAVITLVEEHELSALKVSDLGEKVRERHMAWYHIPIKDGAIPSPQFEAKWAEVGEGLRARLRDGFNVLVHCKGGLGRAGTIASRLMIELGITPAEAVRHRPPSTSWCHRDGRAARSMCWRSQESPEAGPDTSPAAMKDRAIGALLGLAVGDAVGTTLEFKSARQLQPPLTDMVGGGPFRLKAGPMDRRYGHGACAGRQFGRERWP